MLRQRDAQAACGAYDSKVDVCGVLFLPQRHSQRRMPSWHGVGASKLVETTIDALMYDVPQKCFALKHCMGVRKASVHMKTPGGLLGTCHM